MPEGTAGIIVAIYLYNGLYYAKIRKKKKEVIIMLPIGHILDLKNRFPETGKPVDNVEMKLDEADRISETTEERLSHDDVFRNVRSAIHDKCKYSECDSQNDLI